MRRLGAFLLLCVVAGCGAPKGKVSGRVLYQGKPLPGGLVTFQPADSNFNAVVATLDEEGNYEATLPPGEVQVAVDNRMLQPRAPALKGIPADLPAEVKKAIGQAQSKQQGPPAAPTQTTHAPEKTNGKYVPISPKYYTIEDNGLGFTVQAGDQKHDIELK